MTNVVKLFPLVRGARVIFPPTDYNTAGVGTIGRIEDGVSAGEKVAFVTCEEAPGMLFNSKYLLEQQPTFRQKYGKENASPCRY